MKYIALCLVAYVAMSCFTSCKEKHEAATLLLQEIRDNYDAGNYDAALLGIDSLRRTYPDALEQRKEALTLHQDASLAKAQQHLAIIDSTLQAVENEYNEIKPIVEAKHRQGTATAVELHNCNLLRARRDSLKGVFEVECAKIKYIHKRQKQ